MSSVLIKHASVGNGTGTNPTGAAGGDLLGTFPNPSVVAATFNATRLPFSSTAPSSKQLLQYDGSNIVGVGGATRISQATASSSAVLDFTGLTGYTAYQFVYNNIVPATNAVDLWLRTSTNNGSSYDTANYFWNQIFTKAAGPATGSGANSATANVLFGSVSNGAGLGISGVLTFNPGTASSRNTFVATQSGWASDSNVYLTVITCLGPVGPVNAIRFMFSSGNISTGTITVYGLY